MGYACPVCGDPQADAEHLANHLAFTAMLGDADHESWLDERVPDWADRDPDALGAALTDEAEEREYPQVFEDTTDHGPDHDPERSGALFDDEPDLGDGFATRARERVARDRERYPDSDADREAILEEAREMTRKMLDGNPGERESRHGNESEGADGTGGEESEDGAETE